jgi:ADP-heptose:LPS heptosyltransferase
MCTPAVRALRERFPRSFMAFLVEKESSDILKLNPHLNELLVLDRSKYRDPVYWIKIVLRLRKMNFDLTVDFLGNPRTAYLSFLSGARQRLGYDTARRRLFYNLAVKTSATGKYSAAYKLEMLECLGIRSKDVRLDFLLSLQARSFAQHFFEENRLDQKDLIVSVSPTSRRHFRLWPLERYAQLADWLISEFGAKVILVWGPGEKETVERVKTLMSLTPLVCRETSDLLQLGAVLERCDLHIGNDNGTKHIAVAVGRPTITIYSVEDPRSWTYPEPSRHKFLKAEVDCPDCHKTRYKCSQLECLNRIQVKDVQKVFRDLLSGLKECGEKGLVRKIERPAID